MSLLPIFAPETATTVRQRSAWLLSLPAYGAVFLAVALAAYGWMFLKARPLLTGSATPAIARVCIHHPDFAFQRAWQVILEQAKTEICANLQIEGQRSGQQTVVTISLSRLPAETIVPMVNVVAAAYLEACRMQWKLDVERCYAAAEEKVRQTKRQALEAQERFESLRDRRLQALANFRPAQSQPSTTIDNPHWTVIAKRLANLEEHERNLLVQCTPLHPSVKQIELQIADVRRQMASIPPKMTPARSDASPLAALPPDAPAPGEIEEAQQVVERWNEDLRQAQAAERAALTARGEELQVDLFSAEPPPAPRRATVAMLGKALVTATTSIVGLGMISVGASMEPALSTLAELQAVVTAPIVGVIPATHPSRRRASSARRQRLARWGGVTAGLALLVATAWIFFLG